MATVLRLSSSHVDETVADSNFDSNRGDTGRCREHKALQHAASQGKGNPLDMGHSQARANPCNAPIFTRNEIIGQLFESLVGSTQAESPFLTQPLPCGR